MKLKEVLKEDDFERKSLIAKKLTDKLWDLAMPEWEKCKKNVLAKYRGFIQKNKLIGKDRDDVIELYHHWVKLMEKT